MSARIQHPIAAALAVTLRGDAVLLARRRNPPNAGQWGFPGGKIALGEPALAAAERELLEETGVEATATAVFDHLDMIERDALGAVRFHYTLAACLCLWRRGEGVAADDVDAIRWFSHADLAALPDETACAHVGKTARTAFRIRAAAAHVDRTGY